MDQTDAAPEPRTVAELIALWPDRRAFAGEIGVKVETVYKWPRTGRIPPEYQSDVVEAAQRQGHAFCTAEWMLRAHRDLPRRNHASSRLSAAREDAAASPAILQGNKVSHG